MNTTLGYDPTPDDLLYLFARRRALLEITAAHFNSENRAVDNNDSCFYRHSASGGCAIGRLVTEELAARLNGTVADAECWPHLPLHIIELGQRFLQDLQTLHDTPSNWTLEGLSEKGRRTVADIVTRHCTHNPWNPTSLPTSLIRLSTSHGSTTPAPPTPTAQRA